jgi:hypothetical protein
MEQTVIQRLAGSIGAYKNCVANGNDEWVRKHMETIEDMEKNYLPHGAGIDVGCKVDMDKSTDKKVVIHTSFHHMNEVGMYDGWTEHTITVKPDFTGIDITISGRDRNGIKDYLGEVFHTALLEMV